MGLSALVLLALAAAPDVDAATPHRAVVLCTNPASGAKWVLNIDYDRATVDSNPAEIDAIQVAWHDAKDMGNYTLDRRSGELSVVFASSTGGYFLHDTCKLTPSR